MNLYKAFCLIFLLFCKVSSLAAMESVPLREFSQRAYLVHVTSVLLQDSTAIGGSLTNGTIIPDGKAIRHRATFHTCCGGIVPEECMISVSNFFGLPMISKVEGHSEGPYAYLEPFEAFQGERIGGQLNDCFIFDRHQYGKNAVIILPGTDHDKFWEGNANFTGEVVAYDAKTTSLREIVNTTLEQKQAWRITFEGQRGGQSYDYPVIRINGIEVDATLLNEQFKNLILYQGNYNHSHFGILESLLGYLNRPFACFYFNTGTNVRKTLVPSAHATVLRTLIEYQFYKLSEEIQSFSMEKQKTFLSWQQDTSRWISLYFRLLRLAEEKKGFDQPEAFGQLVAAYTQEGVLELISKEVPILEKSFIIGDPDDLGLLRYVPAYWDSLSYMSVGNIQEALNYVEMQRQPWSNKTFVSSYLFFKKIFKNPLQLPENMDPILISAFDEGAKELSWIQPSTGILGKGPVEFFRDQFFEMFDDPNKKEEHLFALMNVSGIKSALSILLHAPSWNEIELIKLADILTIAPEAALLYGEPTDYTRCAAFVRPSLLKVIVNSFKEAKNLNACFVGFFKALSVTPLNTNGIKNDLIDQIKLTVYQEAKMYFEVIQSKGCGTLDEIFTFYDLQKEFREAYPTDENFWNVPVDWTGFAPSFEGILRGLMEKKEKRV